MSILHNNPFLLASGSPTDPTFPVQRSVRLRSSASAYFNRTPASAGNQQKWTWSGWVKRGTLGTVQTLFGAGTGVSNRITLSFQADNTFAFNYGNVTTLGTVLTTSTFRDSSAWYHLVIVIDTTNATAADRVIIYKNNERQPVTIPTQIAQNATTYVNAATPHTIGREPYSVLNLFDGYLTEVNFIDGQALTPSSFGGYNSGTGVWEPIKYTGTYGTNGFYLNFQDNSGATATTIGKDSSGNGNNWTPNNISVTAGVTYDSMTDVPTLSGTNNSNYCTWNPLNISQGIAPISDGNLKVSYSASANKALGSIFVTSGKWYAEFTAVQVAASNADAVGISSQATGLTAFRGYNPQGQYYTGSAWVAYGAAYGNGDVIGIAVDVGAQTVTFYKNNVAQPTQSSIGLSELTFIGWASGSAGNNYAANFGQRPFTYTPPTGFKALNTFNLPDPIIANGSAYVAASLWTGNAASTRSITNDSNNTLGITFQPDFVWIKNRSAITYHGLYDSNRGVNKVIFSNDTLAEINTPANGYVSAFNSNGFQLTAGTSSSDDTNKSANTYAGWQWKAGGTASSNTSGTITASVTANQTAGFSISTYTGNGTNGATVGHGLGVAPAFGMFKIRVGSIGNWVIYHKSLGATKALNFGTGAAQTSAAFFNNTEPTSSVWSLGVLTDLNRNTSTYVSYSFSEISGYSKFGSFVGNGSVEGPFIFCGFRPRIIFFKKHSSATNAQGWTILDTSRLGYNAPNYPLYPSLTNAEAVNNTLDILSNGFKIRVGDVYDNENAQSYVYAAFAENPFKYSLAR